MTYTPYFVLNEIVRPCSRNSNISHETTNLEGVHSVLCAKEISLMLNNHSLLLETYDCPEFEKHAEGKDLIANWARQMKMEFENEVDISVGVADVVVYADDVGIFEIGSTRPSKIILLLKYIAREKRPFSVHFWPYAQKKAFVFKNWR